MVEDRVRDLHSGACGIFQLYFYNNLFHPNANNKIQDKATLNKSIMETLLNEYFVFDNQDENEEIIRQYANDNGVTVT